MDAQTASQIHIPDSESTPMPEHPKHRLRVVGVAAVACCLVLFLAIPSTSSAQASLYASQAVKGIAAGTSPRISDTAKSGTPRTYPAPHPHNTQRLNHQPRHMASSMDATANQGVGRPGVAVHGQNVANQFLESVADANLGFASQWTRKSRASIVAFYGTALIAVMGVLAALTRSRVSQKSPALAMMAMTGKLQGEKLLVFGGSGFVGQAVIRSAIKNQSFGKVVAVSRSGKAPEGEWNKDVEFMKCDATDPEAVAKLIQTVQPSATLHCIGALFDDVSALSGLNKYASGSGSSPSPGASYDDITRKTLANIAQGLNSGDNKGPLAFISCAESGWTESKMGGKIVDQYIAPDFLKRYLKAKRQVEALLTAEDRATHIFRPSLIWTKERPQALPSVLPFYALSPFLDFIDKPVMVETLADAVLESLLAGSDSDVYRVGEMETLAKRFESRNE